MSLTPVVDTGGKFAAGVVEIDGNLPPVSLTRWNNLLPVLLITVVHLHLKSLDIEIGTIRPRQGHSPPCF